MLIVCLISNHCAASVSMTMHSIQLCHKKNLKGVVTRAPKTHAALSALQSLQGQLLCHWRNYYYTSCTCQ